MDKFTFKVERAWFALPCKHWSLRRDLRVPTRNGVEETLTRENLPSFLDDISQALWGHDNRERAKIITSLFSWSAHPAGHSFWSAEFGALYDGHEMSPLARLILTCWFFELERMMKRESKNKRG